MIDEKGLERALAAYNASWQAATDITAHTVDAVTAAAMRAAIAAYLSARSAEPVAWQSMETAPRDGSWFEARTASGYCRRVHFAADDDRLPIDHTDEAWSTVPVEWRPLTSEPIAALAEISKIASLQAKVASLMQTLQETATAEGRWQYSAESAAVIAKSHAHHAMWVGLPTDSLDAFGISLAQRIETAIRANTARALKEAQP